MVIQWWICSCFIHQIVGTIVSYKLNLYSWSCLEKISLSSFTSRGSMENKDVYTTNSCDSLLVLLITTLLISTSTQVDTMGVCTTSNSNQMENALSMDVWGKNVKEQLCFQQVGIIQLKVFSWIFGATMKHLETQQFKDLTFSFRSGVELTSWLIWFRYTSKILGIPSCLGSLKSSEILATPISGNPLPIPESLEVWE